MRQTRTGAGAAVLVLAAAVLLMAPPARAAETAPAADAPTLPLPPPPWYTDDVHRRVLAAGGARVEVPLAPQDEPLVLSCLGYSPPSTSPPSLQAVSAGGCMVYPHGCSMNFVFTDGAASYVGTAGHCVDKGGDVVMQVGTRVDPTDTVLVTVAKVGRVAKRADGGIGRDFGLVRIDPGWAVQPAIAGAMGPTGVFCGDPLGQPVLHYGHGYAIEVGPGDPKAGEVIPDATPLFRFASEEYGYNWVGYGLPGDSGSPVLGVGALAVGNLTHGIGVGFVPVPGLNFGMTMAGIFNLIGSKYALVTADGRAVRCGGILGL
jgi:hypothetical protein